MEYQSEFTKEEGNYGYCGIFAIALNRTLFKNKASYKALIFHYEENDYDLNHVFLEYKEYIYHSEGRHKKQDFYSKHKLYVFDIKELVDYFTSSDTTIEEVEKHIIHSTGFPGQNLPEKLQEYIVRFNKLKNPLYL